MSHDDLRTRLWAMPAAERCAMLSLSVIELDRKNGPAMAVHGLLKLIGEMAGYLGIHDRVALAERCRDLADTLEHRERVN